MNKSLHDIVSNYLIDRLGFDDSHLVNVICQHTNNRHALQQYCVQLFGDDQKTNEFIEQLISVQSRLTTVVTNDTTISHHIDTTMTIPTPQQKIQQQHQRVYSGSQRGRGVTVKYVDRNDKSLGSNGGKRAMRVECGCNGIQHDLFINCTVCGRIHCVVEGAGSCFYCDSIINTSKVTTAATQLLPSMIDSVMNDTSQHDAAVAAKNILLAYEATSSERTRVHDQQGDGAFDHETNAWMSEEDKRIAGKRADQYMTDISQRKAHRIAIDVDNRTVIAESSESLPLRPSTTKQQVTNQRTDTNSTSSVSSTDEFASNQYSNSTLTGKARVVYQQLLTRTEYSLPTVDNAAATTWSTVAPLPNMYQTISAWLHDEQYSDVAEAQAAESGTCLSLHQPWASLCVAGIKRYEGRGWRTSYRGRLFIASTAQEISSEEIESLESEYKSVYSTCAGSPPFPKHYPTSALLGCVDLTDCMDNNTFQRHRTAQLRRSVAIENSVSPYIMQFENPHQMMLPHRHTGQHKMYTLDANVVSQVQVSKDTHTRLIAI